MGVDTFGILAPSRCITAYINNEPKKVACFKWVARYRDWRDAASPYTKYDRMLAARIAKMEKAWDYEEVPEYFVILRGDEKKPQKDYIVYKSDQWQMWYHDCNDQTIVGMLKPDGKSWLVVPEYKCWECKDTGFYQGTYMGSFSSSPDPKMWVHGSVCCCNPAGDEAARERWVKEFQRKAAQKEREAAKVLEEMAAKQADISLDSSGL